MARRLTGCSFFNGVWLIANDIIIGAAVGGFICDNKYVLAQLGSQLIQASYPTCVASSHLLSSSAILLICSVMHFTGSTIGQ
jgi:hypothetical protein